MAASKKSVITIIPLTGKSCCGYCFAKPSEMEEPRALPCGHSQCTPCIEVDNRKLWMICKVCREEFHGIEDITTLPLVPEEFIAAAVTDAAEPNLPKFPCVLCRKNPLNAVTCCTTCKRRFCHQHAEEHEIHAEDHRMIPIEYESSPDRYKVELCQTHKGRTLSNICKLCEEKFCNHCTARDICFKGESHEVTEVTDDMREQLLKLKDELYAKIKKCRNIEKSAWRELSDYEDHVADIHKEVDTTIDELIRQLREEGERLKQQFTDDYISTAAEVDKFSEDKLVSITELDDLFREGEELAERGSDMEVLTRFSELSNQMSDQIKDREIDSSFEIVQPVLLKGDYVIESGMSLKYLPKTIEHVRTEKCSDYYYAVNFDTEGNILCDVQDGVELRAADDLSLLRKITVSGHVHSAQSTVGDSLMTKVDHASKSSTCTGTEDNPKQTLLHEVKYEGDGKISHMSATSNKIAVIDFVNKQLRVFSAASNESLFSISLTDMKRPWGVHILTNNNAVLVTDCAGGELRKYPLEADAAPVWRCAGLKYPSGVTSDESGLIYVSHNGGKKIYLISPQGELVRELSSLELDVGVPVHDLAVYGGRLAIANRDKGVKLFNLK